MVWIVGTRKKKFKNSPEGPRAYTAAVLKSFMRLGRSPVERASFARMLRFVEIGRFEEFAAVPGSIGLINSEEIALLRLEGFLELQMGWLDAETKVGGKAVYAKKINAAFSALAKDISFRGKWDVFASHLIRKASRLYGWS